MVTADRLDLSRLALDRGPDSPGPKPGRRQSRGRFVARVVLPGLILAGTALMGGWAARDVLRPATKVTVVPVVVRQADVKKAGTPLFTAAGWVEPRPMPTYVSSLASGVVAQLLVVAGQEVKEGEVVARLIDTDAKFAVERADADVRLAKAAIEQAEAEATAARLAYETPHSLQAALAEADSLLAEAEGELALLPSQIESAEARRKLAEQTSENRRAARDSVAGRMLIEAEGELRGAVADLAGLSVRLKELPRRTAALRKRRDVLARQAELRSEELRRATTADAEVRAAEARSRQAEIALESAKLRLARATVRAPAAGRVLDVLAGPGSYVSGQETQAGGNKASAIVGLYDPSSLQVRADVRLEDVPRVYPGAPAIVETAASAEPIRAVVLSATSSANVQKNTLEVKVGLESPPPSVRPEMLVKTTFLAPPTDEPPSDEERKRQRILVPRRLVEGEGAARSIWIAEADGTARKRAVTLGEAGDVDLVEVSDGLRPTDRLISGGRESLSDGDRIEITEEDAA